MKQIAATTNEALQAEKVLNALAKSQTQELPDVLSQMEPSTGQASMELSTAVDVTAKFLAPVADKADETHPDSSISVYKGLLRRLSGMKPPSGTIAILAGSDMAVVDVVIAQSIESANESPEVRNYWDQQGHEVLGAAIFDYVSDPEHFEDLLKKLPTSSQTLLFMSFSGGYTPDSWIATRATSEEGSSAAIVWSRVKVGTQTTTRRKHEKISFVHASKIGVTFDDEVWC